MKNLSPFVLVILVAIMTTVSASAQNKPQKLTKQEKRELRIQAKAIEIDSILNSGAFIFEAKQLAGTPSIGPKSLGTAFFFEVTKTKLVSQLPFYGSSININLAKLSSPLSFTSTDFTVTNNQVGEDPNTASMLYTFIAKPDDNNNLYNVKLQVFRSGEATLSISTKNDTSSSFLGIVSSIE